MSKIKISKEIAIAEVKTFLEAHYIDVDTEEMEDEEAEATESMIAALARPIQKGRANIEGKNYTLKLLEPQGDLKEVVFEGMTFAALTHSSRAKSGDSIAMEGQVVAAMVKITYAELCKFHIQDFMVLNYIKKLFIAA